MVRNHFEGQYPRNTDTGNMNDDDGLLQWRGYHMVTTSIDKQLHQRYIINENYGKQDIFLFEEK